MIESRLLKRSATTVLFVSVVILAGISFDSSPRSALAEPEDSTPPTSESRGMSRSPWDTADHLNAEARLVVKKGERKLFLYSGNALIRTYRVGLGLSPVGDKVRQGDRRTPEGDFYIFVKNDKSAFYLSLGLSYPNEAHAARGLRDGLITRPQHDAILKALKAKRTPPQNTSLGGDIYIHGNGANSDWTWGCVALADGDMRELFNAVTVGTPVTIKP
jgi:lipoprotein-anchoring transpeptidase ErfK/SrfK